jgi:hypothetical protein
MPLYPKVLQAKKMPQPLIFPLFSPLGLIVESIKEFGGASHRVIDHVVFD